MKSGNYNELLDKFYAGTANTEEISLLQLEGLLNEPDALYAEILKAERGQKMDWEFEDFMKEIPSEKIVAFPARSVWVKRILSAAAMVAAIVMAYIFWPQPTMNKTARIAASNKMVDSNKENIASAVLPASEIKDTAETTRKINTVTKKNTDYAVTVHKKRPLQKSVRQADKADTHKNKNLHDYLVIVNGQPIMNEADAVAITRASLGMVFRKLALTVDELKPISRIKIKL